MTKNYFREGQLAQRLAELGCREVEIETYLQADRNGDRTLDIDGINSAWADAEKSADGTAHRWHGGSTADQELFRAAFVGVNGRPPSIDAQGSVVTKFGPIEAARIAEAFDAKLGSRKPGIDPSPPDPETEKQHTSNPWAATAANVDPKTGKYTPEAIRKQFSATRAMGSPRLRKSPPS